MEFCLEKKVFPLNYCLRNEYFLFAAADFGDKFKELTYLFKTRLNRFGYRDKRPGFYCVGWIFRVDWDNWGGVSDRARMSS